MKILTISMGRLYKDLMVHEGIATYQNVSFSSATNTKYIKVMNKNITPIYVCVPAKSMNNGLLLELGGQSENYIGKDILNLLPNDQVCIGYLQDEKDTFANKIMFKVQEIYLNRNDILFNAYNLKIELDGIYIWPTDLGIDQLLSLRMVSETGKEVSSENVIHSKVIDSKLYYEFHICDYGINGHEKIKDLDIVFSLDYTSREERK